MRLLSYFLVCVSCSWSTLRWWISIVVSLWSFLSLFGQPNFTLDAPATARVGELVPLTASFEGASGNVRYRFVYSDQAASESDWQRLPVTLRNFIRTGDVQVYVEARTPSLNNVAGVHQRAQQNPVFTRSGTKTIRVLPALPTITLHTITSRPKAGQPVQWSISRTPKNQSLRYQFDPGDNTGTVEGTNPTIEHTYTTARNFTASVQLLDAESAPRSRVQVRVAAAPAPTLTAAPTTAEIGGEVVLSANYTTGDNAARFRFHFGDQEAPSPWIGSNSISHVYRQSGTHTCFVEITHGKGNDARPEARSAPREVTIRPALSVTLDVSNSRAFVGDEIDFKLTSNRPELRPQFTIDFGDGTKQVLSDSATVTHAFKEAEMHEVAVVAEAKIGRATTQKRITIEAAPAPTLDVSPATAEIDGIVQFVANYTRADQRTRYRFTFGDGTPHSPWLTAPRISRRYTRSGSFKAIVEAGTVSNKETSNAPLWLSSSAPREITILPALAVKITPTTSQIHVGDEAVFTVSTTREDIKSIYTYGFSDGKSSAPSSATSASHIFLQPGDAVASVSAKTDLGVAKDEVHFTVLAAAHPTLTAEPASPEVGDSVKLTAVPASSGPQFRYRFNFGDNGPATDWLAGPATEHAYQQRGSYRPSVEVGVVRGRSTESLSIGAEASVTVPPPLEFSLLPPVGETRAGRTLTFERKTNRPEMPTSLSVDFGDGSAIQSFSPRTEVTHKFIQHGNYSVKWTAEASRAKTNGSFTLVATSSIPIWVIVLVSIAAASGAAFVPHRLGWIAPSLHLKPNLRTVRVKAKSASSTKMEIRLNRNLPSLRSKLVVKIKPRVEAPDKIHV